MANKTTQSIVGNIIDPTNYLQGGGLENCKLGFENIPEDWIMYVQLFVKPRNRSVLLKTEEGKLIASDEQEYLVANIPYYDKCVNKNTSGDIIPFDIQTTEYTDLFGAKGLPMTENGTPNTLGQESAFGMSNINIDFADVRQPTIDITFVDVRGAGLSSYGPTGKINRSPYSWFFLMPYPEFCLKVKGFYGKTISLPCLLTKFDMKYNNTTGNFDITTKFVGYPFSVLNDVSIKVIERLCCVPGGPEELENTYDKLQKCLDPNNPDEAIILQEMPRREDLCIKEYIRAIESGKIDNPIQKSYSQATKIGQELDKSYTELIKEINRVLTLVRGRDSKDSIYGNFKSLILKCCQTEQEFQKKYTTSSKPSKTDPNSDGLGGRDNVNKDVLTSKTNQSVNFQIVNFSDYITENNIPVNKFSRITLNTSNAYFDPCITDGKDIVAEKTFKDNLNKVLSSDESNQDNIVKSLNTSITKDIFVSAMNSGSSMNAVEKSLLMLRSQYIDRLNYLKNYTIFICNYFQKIEKRFEKEFTEELRVRPSLQRIMTLLAINVEAFLNLLLKTSIRAEKYHEANKTTALYTSYFTDSSNQQVVNVKGSNTTTSASLRGVKLYAWPKTYKFNGQGNKEEVFPPVLSDEFNDWPEVKFTKSFIDGIGSQDCYSKKTTKSTDNGSTGTWSSLNIFEDTPFTKNKPLNQTSPLDSPYNNELMSLYFSNDNNSDTDIGVKTEKLNQLIVSRAIINLFYFNRLFDQNADISTEAQLNIINEYVKQLAERDALNLTSTLDQCNLIEVLDKNFGGQTGVNTLTTYSKKPSVFNFSENLMYTDKPKTRFPYSSIFYLGNNVIKSRVDEFDQQYYRNRTIEETLSDILSDNYYGLSFYDKPQYPFVKYVTIHLNNNRIISGYEYDTTYKDNILNVSLTQNVIYNYCPWYNPNSASQISPPLGIPLSTIPNPELSRNYFYDIANIVKYITYEPFLNPSHIRDISVFNLMDESKLPKEQPYTISPINPKNQRYETGNGIPSWSNLFKELVPELKSNIKSETVGIDSFNSYKFISETKDKTSCNFNNNYQPINLYDSDKTYYYGVDPLLINLNTTIRNYHTTYNHYNSDTLKSFLWDPYKTKIGNPVTKLGSQEKSVYNIVTNLNKPELQNYNYVGNNGSILTKVFNNQNKPLEEEFYIGSSWFNDTSENTGFQNTIFFSTLRHLPHTYVGSKEFPIFNSGGAFNPNSEPSLLQYLFINNNQTTTLKPIPENSTWLEGFGGKDYLGKDYNNNTYTMKEIIGGNPFETPSKYFLDYTTLIYTKNLSTNSLYEIPVDMNSTWFRAKMFEYNKNITPVKKYQTQYMKKLSYTIWKEASSRILTMCEINLSKGVKGIVDDLYHTNNQNLFTSVYLVDEPSKRPGGVTNSSPETLFEDTYPQSKFQNRNIDVYNDNPNFSFYGFNDDTTGTYRIGSNSNDTFDGTSIPGPDGINGFFPNDNPTDNTSLTQPPLISRPLSDYSDPNVILKPQWTRMFINQTDWWKNMTTDSRLSNTGNDEYRLMKTYLTLMSLWGGNAMDSLIYNYPLMSPSSGLFRVNNIDLVTLGAFLWGAEGKLYNGEFVKNVITTHQNFIYDPTLSLNFGDPTTAFPFNVIFKDTRYGLTTFDRFVDYGVICTSSINRGETVFTSGSSTQQQWKMVWKLKNPNNPAYSVTPLMISNDVKRDLVNHFLQFCETSEFSKNIDDNLNGLSMMREISEIALKTVETPEGDYLKFPFDIEQTLLMWGDWASIVDLNNTTSNFKSYYDDDDGFRVKRPEQKTILSGKLFDVLGIELTEDHIDNPFKIVKTYTINTDDYYYSPWIRIDGDLLMLKGDVGKKVMNKLLKVITLEEQNDSPVPIVNKKNGKYETTLNYKQKSVGKTLPGNDMNYFFEYLFKGFYYPTIYGGMKTTNYDDYDENSLGSNKLFFSKSWREIEIPNVSDVNGMENISSIIPNSERLQTYFTTFCDVIGKIKVKNSNYEKCKNSNKPNVSENYNVDLGNDSLITYKTFTNLFNRWLAGTTEENHTYQKSGCNNIIGGPTDCTSLIKNIFIVDRVNRPAGHLVCGNQDYFAKFFQKEPDKSVMTFVSDFVTSPDGGIGGFSIEYPTFFNFGNSGLNLEDNPGQAMWGMTTSVDEKYGGPAIVIYVQRGDSSEANTALNDFVNDDMVATYRSKTETDHSSGYAVVPDDFATPDSRGVMFKVAIGNENNNIFTNLQISSEEFKISYEHINNLTQIANEVNTGTPKFLNQNLYNLYLVRSYTASIECFGNMLIQPGMFFYLENMPIFRGVYIIKKVKHTIEPHNIKTQFWGNRINQIPAPYVNRGAVGSYYSCNNLTLDVIPETINNDPGYCKETMLTILDSFINEVERLTGVRPIVNTSDDFLTSLGFSEDDSFNFYNKYDVMVNKIMEDKPFDNVRAISVTQSNFTDDFIDDNFIKPIPDEDRNSLVGDTASALGLVGYPCDGLVTDVYDTMRKRKPPKIGYYKHGGIDIGNKEGTPIYSIAAGVIVKMVTPIINTDNSGGGSGYGNHIAIKHTLPNGSVYLSFYAHLRKVTPYAPGIYEGMPITGPGILIGYMGNTGNSRGNHLHLSLYQGDQLFTNPKDPAEILPLFKKGNTIKR